MQIIIMRHGEAILHANCDEARSLTPRGHDESCDVADWLKYRDINIERVLVSPYLRARQTLAAVRERLALPKEQVLPILTPTGNISCVMHHLRTLHFEGIESLLLISHLPLVGFLSSELCSGKATERRRSQPPLSFETSMLVCVEHDIEKMDGWVSWSIGPTQLYKEKKSYR